MRKIIFVVIIFMAFVGNIKAFDINIENLNISNKSANLVKELNPEYKIEATGYEKNIIYDEEIINLTKELIDISIKDISIDEKNQLFTKYIYYDRSDGFQTLTSSLFIDTFVKQLDGKKIELDYIKAVRTVEFSKGFLSFAYLPNVSFDGKKTDMVLAYWLIKDESGYKLHYPWFNLADNLESYFNEIAGVEDNGGNIGSTFKSISLNTEESVISEDELRELYNQNKGSVLQITGLNHEGVNAYGSAFFLRKGIVVTSWSLFLQMLNESEFIYVNDGDGNSYTVSGIVAGNIDYDVVVLKLSDEIGQEVKFGNSDDLKTNDKLFMINSKNNSSFSINYGSFVAAKNGKLENLLVINKADVGACLFNLQGEVVGFNIAEVLYSELSYANSTDYLKELQDILIKMDFAQIDTVSFLTFKKNYYNDISQEETNTISDEVWNKYKQIGNLEESISLKLIKAYYEDGVLSLRYKNNVANSLGTFYFISTYIDNLEKQNFSEIYRTDKKIIFKNKNYRIVLKNNMNYLVILIMELK